MMTRMVLPLLAICYSVSGEMYRLHNLFSDDPRIETIDKPSGRALDERKLSILEVGTFDSINATTDTCEVVGAGIRCNVESSISADDGDKADIKVQVDCPLDSQIAFDFRRAHGCSCGASVTHWDGRQKFCPCIICPQGFGNSPVSIDCSMREDPYIISTCTYMDCGFACNGTCEFSCKNSGPGCTFCEGNAEEPAESYAADNPLPPSLLSYGDLASTYSAIALFLATVLGMLL